MNAELLGSPTTWRTLVGSSRSAAIPNRSPKEVRADVAGIASTVRPVLEQSTETRDLSRARGPVAETYELEDRYRVGSDPMLINRVDAIARLLV